MNAADQKVFADSNVVLYLLSKDARKADDAENVLSHHPVISVQLLNEVTNVCRRKLKMSWQETGEFVGLIRQFCKVVPVTVEIHEIARIVAELHKFSFYDAAIIAAAITSGCSTLYSEDMHHGQVLADSLTIRNPFIPSPQPA